LRKGHVSILQKICAQYIDSGWNVRLCRSRGQTFWQIDDPVVLVDAWRMRDICDFVYHLELVCVSKANQYAKSPWPWLCVSKSGKDAGLRGETVECVPGSGLVTVKP
jgi:hypothetical protein